MGRHILMNADTSRGQERAPELELQAVVCSTTTWVLRKQVPGKRGGYSCPLRHLSSAGGTLTGIVLLFLRGLWRVALTSWLLFLS